MKPNLLVIGGSNSRNSINKILASYAVSQIKTAEAWIVDLNDFELPLYCIYIEKASGIPENALKLFYHLRSTMGLSLLPLKTLSTGCLELIGMYGRTKPCC